MHHHISSIPRRLAITLLVALMVAVPVLICHAEPRIEPDLDRQATNVAAFARLYGLIRWFHPSDEAAKADWGKLAIAGVHWVRHARDEQELAGRLESFFLPWAPSLRVFPSELEVPIPATLSPPQSATCVGVRIWEHAGVGTTFSPDLGDIYHSARLWLSASELESGLYEPYEPLRADLGGDVAAWVATSVYGDTQGTFPQATAEPVETDASAATATEALLADALVIWNTMAHFYPYFDVVEKDWHAVLETVIASILEAGETYSYNDMRADLCVPLRDGHAGIWSPPTGGGYAKAIPDISLAYIGGQAIVTAVEGETAEAGIVPGDRVLSLDDVPADEVLSEWMDPVSGSPQQRLALGIVRLPLGKKDSQLELEVEAIDGSVRTISLSRSRPYPLSPKQLEPIAEIEPGILYVDVSRASSDMLASIRASLRDCRGLIIDVRGYPRDKWWADSFTATRLTSLALRIPVNRKPNQSATTYRDVTTTTTPKLRIAPTAELVFVVDTLAFSAGEHQLSYFVNAGIGTLVGTATAGTNGDINRIPLPSGGSMAWTGMRVEWPDGSRFHTVGIQPDVWVEPTREGIAQGRDEQLDAAIEILRQKLGNGSD